MDTIVRCTACSSNETEFLFEKSGFRVFRCVQCGVGFYSGTPGATERRALYSRTYFTEGGAGYPDYVGDQTTHRRQARYYLRQFKRRGISTGRLLDVGCATGFFLDEARLQGWDVYGYDISDYAVQHARDVLGLPVVCDDFVDAEVQEGSFDLVTLFNVFEHLPSPWALEEKLARVTRPGGHLAIETWDRSSLVARLLRGRWHQYAPPSVLFYHDRASLLQLFSSSRWRLVGYGRSIKWISLEHGISVLRGAAKPGLRTRILTRIAQSPLGSVYLPYGLGDLVLAIFQRR
jgi:SAM-dependent methyltransferase